MGYGWPGLLPTPLQSAAIFVDFVDISTQGLIRLQNLQRLGWWEHTLDLRVATLTIKLT